MSEASVIPSWARVGAKVVCVADRKIIFNDLGYEGAVAGTTYEIAETGRQSRGYDFIRLVGFADNHWHALYRFRPAVEPKSEVEDVALFRHHLTKRQPVDA